MTRQEMLERTLGGMVNTESASDNLNVVTADFLSSSPEDLDAALNAWVVWGNR